MAPLRERILEILKCLYSRNAEITERIEGRWIIYGIYIPGNSELWLSPSEVDFLVESEVIECDGGGENLRTYILSSEAREKIDKLRLNPERLLE